MKAICHPDDYKQLADLSVADIMLLRQVYQRLRAEGYEPGFNSSDFLDIVVGRGEHQVNYFREMETLQELSPHQQIKVEVQ